LIVQAVLNHQIRSDITVDDDANSIIEMVAHSSDGAAEPAYTR
jgi:hypothetical protein